MNFPQQVTKILPFSVIWIVYQWRQAFYVACVKSFILCMNFRLSMGSFINAWISHSKQLNFFLLVCYDVCISNASSRVAVCAVTHPAHKTTFSSSSFECVILQYNTYHEHFGGSLDVIQCLHLPLCVVCSEVCVCVCARNWGVVCSGFSL